MNTPITFKEYVREGGAFAGLVVLISLMIAIAAISGMPAIA